MVPRRFPCALKRNRGRFRRDGDPPKRKSVKSCARVCSDETYSQEVVDHDQQVLDGGVFRDMAQKVQESLRGLERLILQVLSLLLAVQSADALIILVGNHLRLIVRLPVDFLHADVTSLLLENASGCNHVW